MDDLLRVQDAQVTFQYAAHFKMIIIIIKTFQVISKQTVAVSVHVRSEHHLSITPSHALRRT